MPWSRRNPIEEIEAMLERMGTEFDAREWPLGRSVAVDVADHGDRYVVTADLPGYDKADIDVRYAGGTLSIAATRDAEPPDDADVLRRERRQGSVDRRISLPDAVDVDDVTAAYADGVLTVELPKQESGGGTRIDVESDG